MRRLTCSFAVMGLLVSLACAVAAAPLTEREQACVNGQNALAAKVLRAQQSAAEGCVGDGQRGRIAKLGNDGETLTAQACLMNDVRGAVGKAAAKLAAKANALCTAKLQSPPAFGYEDAALIASAMREEALAVEVGLFGDDLDAALASDRAGDPARDPNGARCQRDVADASHELVDTMWRTALSTKRIALRGKGGTVPVPAAASTADLTNVLDDELKAARPIFVALANLIHTTLRRCDDPAKRPLADLSLLFPGCAPLNQDFPSHTLINCAAANARCHACRALAVADQVPLDCDFIDDVSANGSCENPVGAPVSVADEL